MSSNTSRRAFAAAALTVLFMCTGGDPAHAAACPGDLTVAGKPVTGSDCVTAGSGAITITNPVFGTAGNVKITSAVGGDAQMILNPPRTKMEQSNLAQVARLTVGSTPVMIGTVEVGMNDFCDLAEPRSPAAIQGFQQADPETGGYTGEPLLPQTAGCRQLVSFKFNLGMFDKLADIVGLPLGGEHVTANLSAGFISAKFETRDGDPTAAVFRIPRVFLFDDERGGRVQGTVDLGLPKPFTFKRSSNRTGVQADPVEIPIRVGVGIEVSAAEGVKLASLGIDIPREIPTPVPGVKVRDLLAVIDPTNNRFGGGARLVLPGNKAFGGELVLKDGRPERIAVDIGFPTPGIPIFAPPVLFLSSVGATFVGGTTTDGVAGRKTTTPFSVQGRMKGLVGPSIAGQGAFALDGALTVSGTTLRLDAVVSALANAIKLAEAKVKIGVAPFRFEADGNVNVSKSVIRLNGRIFLGVTREAATGLGDLTARVPDVVPFIGGQQLAGFHTAISDKGVGAVIVVDPPGLDPRTVGFGTLWQPINIKRITSVQPFITVAPSGASAASSGDPLALAAGQRTITIPRAARELNVTVTGTKRTPRGVQFLVGKKRLKGVLIGSQGKVAEYGVLRVPRGKLEVTSRDKLSKITVARLATFPYLDPSAGPGSRPQGPVTAGTPVKVCWKTKGAVPKGAVVDVFEDENGSLGNGRLIASGRAANGCLDVPTAGLEPGKHWVYGVLRVGGQLLGTRYWPIAIDIVDPTALPAPTGQTVIATADGVDVSIPPVDGAASYSVIAQPADELKGETVEADVSVTDTKASLSLRGSRDWLITTRAIGADGRPGNLSAPVPITPTDGVVLAGKPHGIAEVGRKWAFPLDTNPGTTVKLLSGPNGMRIAGGAALLQWTPSAKAGRSAPQQFRVEACKADRCVTRSFTLPAYAKNTAPFGPARGFVVTPNVLPQRGGTITIRAQGIDEKPVVKIDGKVLRGVRKIDEHTIEVRTGKLSKGPHEVSLQIGKDAAERRPGAIVVL